MTGKLASLPALLAAACLLALPWAANAQTTPAPMHSTARQAASAHQEHAYKPLAWSQLEPAQQRMLAPVHSQWDQLHPARQHRLATHASHWATLPPAHQKVIRERLARWTQMTPAQRRQLRENARAFHKLTPAQRARVRAAFEHFRSLPPGERRALRKRWHALPPAQRMRWATEHPAKPIPMHAPAHRGH